MDRFSFLSTSHRTNIPGCTSIRGADHTETGSEGMITPGAGGLSPRDELTPTPSTACGTLPQDEGLGRGYRSRANRSVKVPDFGRFGGDRVYCTANFSLGGLYLGVMRAFPYRGFVAAGGSTREQSCAIFGEVGLGDRKPGSPEPRRRGHNNDTASRAVVRPESVKATSQTGDGGLPARDRTICHLRLVGGRDRCPPILLQGLQHSRCVGWAGSFLHDRE